MLDFVRFAAENDGHDPFPGSVLIRLRELVPCDVVSYGDFDPKRPGWRRATRWVGEPRAPLSVAIRDAFAILRHQYPHPPTHSPPILRWSDRVSWRDRTRIEFYRQVLRPLGCEYTLTLWLRDEHAVVGGFAFDRLDCDFSNRDRQVLELLRPHLLHYARRATRRRPGALASLTRREREILMLAARGKTNNQIATSLWLSPGTVRKHFDRIYEKLDVPNRTAAVIRGFGIHLPSEESNSDQAPDR
jgi:DNA-binding CsgD family transcriptional regulator